MTTRVRMVLLVGAAVMLPTITAAQMTPTGPTPTATGTPGCGIAPEAGCRVPAVGGKASLTLIDNPDDRKDKLAWTWARGSATVKSEFGDPLTLTAYDLCIYDTTPMLVLAASLPPAGVCGVKPCWREARHGFVYANKLLTPDGVQQLTLTEGLNAKAKITAKGKGVNLDMPPLPLSPPIRVQLKSTAGVCWEATYSVPSKNDATQFKAKADSGTAATASASPVPTPTLSASATPGTPTPTPVETPMPTLTATPTATATPTVTLTLNATATPTAPPTLTATPTPTATATPAEHYVDNGDGTVTDNYTGLQWEKKDSACPGIHCVDDTYTWSSVSPDGTANTVFLPALAAGGGFAGHTDWRLPTAVELQTILLAPYPCGTSPCIDSVFGPTAASAYWPTTVPPDVDPLHFVLLVGFSDGYVGLGPAGNSLYVRAVRGGS